MMNRGLQQQSLPHQQHTQHNDGQQQPQQSYGTQQPQPLPRSHLSRSISYPVPTQSSYVAQRHENTSSSSLPVPHRDDESNTSQYTGLGISMQGNENSQSQLLPSPDSPFNAQLLSRYPGAGQPPTPSFQNLRSSSPASSVWSASDHGTSSTGLSGFIPRLHKYDLLFLRI